MEDAASGQSLIQELRTTALPILPIKADSDKLSRAAAVTPLLEAGKVFLPESAPWLADYLDELAAFPTGPHDDAVDSTTQALNYLRLNSGGGGIQFVRQPRRWPDPELPAPFPEPFRHESLLTKIL
jgi:phage terminase large subunit-like protein